MNALWLVVPLVGGLSSQLSFAQNEVSGEQEVILKALPVNDDDTLKFPPAIPVAIAVEDDEVFAPIPADQLVTVPTRAQVRQAILANPNDIRALEWGVKQGLVTTDETKYVTRNVFPPETEVFTSHTLPFRKVRIDLFMAGSNIHGIKSEFSVITIDDQVRAIGLISSGAASTPTPARAWEIFGVEKNKKNTKGDAMPYVFLLSEFGDKSYSTRGMHGTHDYGYGRFGSRASNGCLREFTTGSVPKGKADKNANWPQWGYHRVRWELLNPNNVHAADHLSNTVWENWINEGEVGRIYVRELRYKTTVRTHNSASLAKMVQWKSLFETLYSKKVIQKAISQNFYKFDLEKDAELIALDHDAIRNLYEAERALYTTPKYIRTEESETVQYDRRHLYWLEDLERGALQSP